LPEISVIIPNYNHAGYLRQRIDSVLNQTYVDFELIILDDCSTDNSKEIIEQYRGNKKISHIIYNEKNSGSVFFQWEKGLALAKGKYIWIAESDDWAEARFLELLTEQISKHENIGIACCGSNWVDDAGKTGEDRSRYYDSFFLDGKQEVKNVLVKYNSIPNASSALVRRDLALKHIHNLHEYKSCGDWILYVRILQESNLYFLKDKLNNFRWYHNNVSNRAKQEGKWLYEGIEVLKNIDLRKIKFTRSEFRHVRQYWKNWFRANKSKKKPEFNERMKFFKILNGFMLRYFFN
jgi:glycosyltransferase involved in cell wall biosynthesis